MTQKPIPQAGKASSTASAVLRHWEILRIGCLAGMLLQVVSLCTAEGAPALTASNKGVVIDAGTAGKFTFPVPNLRIDEKDFSGEKPVVDFNGSDTITAKYPSGAELIMTVAGSAVECSFSGVPDGARGFVFMTQIPISFSNGGRFSIGNKPLEPFPETKDKQLVGQGTAAKFTLSDAMDAGFRIVTPMDYQQVQDNRVFGWPVFMHIYNYSFKSHGEQRIFSFQFEGLEAAAAATTAPAPTTSAKPAAPAPAAAAPKSAAPVNLQAPALAATNKGIQIDAGSAGKFLLPVPGLRLNDQDYNGEKPVVEFNGSDTLNAKYPSGAELSMTVAGNAVECMFNGVPDSARGFIFQTKVPISFNAGGRFSIGKQALTPFPESKDKQLVGQGTAAAFTLADAMDAGFHIVMPMDYQQVQDNRVFGNPVFMHIYNYSFRSHGDKTSFSLRYEPLDGLAPASTATTTTAAPGAAATAPAKSSPAPTLSATDKGVQIESGAGKLTLPVPGLLMGDKDYSGEKAAVELEGTDTIVARYPSGAELRLTVSNADKSVRGTYQGIPEGAKGFQFPTQIPIKFSGGGKFIIGNQPAAEFPMEKGKQIIKDGGAESFTLIDPAGEGFKIKMPGEYQQVQDNRVFGWPVYMHIYTLNFKTQAGKKDFTLRYSGLEGNETAAAAPSTQPTEPRKFLVDRYGQSARKDFPGKVKSDDELKADGVRELAELAAFKPNPALDIYGGLIGSGEKYGLKKTGFFHAGMAGDRHVLVTPEGNAFFQLALCGISNGDDYTTVRGREKIYEWLPPQDETFKTAWRPNTPGVASFYIANVIRKFGKPFVQNDWHAQSVNRLRSWGFNSSGAFSGNPEAFKTLRFPNVGFLPLGKGDGIEVLPDRIGAAPLIDPFFPGTAEALDKRFAEKIAPKANDPLMIGYYLGNEQHLELLPKLVPTYKASKVAAKASLVQMLQEKYKDIAKFNTAWNPAKPFADFEALKEEPLFIRSDAGAADMKEFYELYLETYFSMVNKAFRKHDPNHILIGSRLTPGTANNEIAVRLSSKYMDVNSINYYSYAIEENYLKRFYDWSGKKPIIFSEWYFAATDHGLNGGKEVKDQQERADGYRNYIEQSAALPFIVGSQWFIYMDQSMTGRFFEGFNGEGANTGFVDVTDRPYKELVEAAKLTHSRIYDVMLGKEKPFAYNEPRFNGKGGGGGNRTVSIPKALPGLKLDGTTTNWPGRPAEPLESSRIVFGAPNPALRGDFRLCWDEKNLYFLIQVKDPTPLKTNKEGDKLWSADGIELFVGAKDVDKTGTMIFSDRQILIGASESPKIHIVDHAEDSKLCQTLVVKDVTGDGYVLQAAIPWAVLGTEPKNGMEMLFDVMIDNSDDGDFRKQQLAWNGTSKNSNDRAAWGRAKLLEN